jgi:uncharacterized protein HemX
MIKQLLAAAALAVFATTGAWAQDKKPANPQHQRMADCNKEAGDRKGEERKKFMSACLKDKQAAQQNKMKKCNADAAGKKGDERKKFMSECLKG